MNPGHGKMKLEKLEYHRNGVCGNGFYVAIAKETTGETKGRKLIVQFPHDLMSTAVFDLDMLAAGTVEFGVNSWRGDYYSHWMYEQYKRTEEEESA